jgi:S-adenosylmethionine/arginine decarboxylase-like enzyme
MGKHLLLEVYNIDFDLINDVQSIQNAMIRGINRTKMTILNTFSHCFFHRDVQLSLHWQKVMFLVILGQKIDVWQ